MLKARFEGAFIDIFHKITDNVTEHIPAGTLVMKDPASPADTVKVSDGTAVWGILSQDVYLNPGQKFLLPFNNFEGYPGDHVGLYTTDGYFETDQFEAGGTYAPGATLYASANGKLTDVPGTIAVGEVIRKDGDLLFFYFKRPQTVVVEEGGN